MANDDRKAFERFFNLLYPRFYRYAFLYLKSDMLSEELVSDVFLKLWNARKNLVEVKELEFYLFRSVKNQALTYLKRNRNHPEELSEFVQSSLVEYRQPENLMIAGELYTQIERTIANLPEKCQVIFRMIREDMMSYKQVAELLQLSPKTIENQMGIALKKIRKAIDDYYGSEQRGSTGQALLSLFL